MEIPQNNVPELAQWYLERGEREKMHLYYGILAFLVPLFAPIVIPLVIAEYRAGSKKVKIGEAMNAAAGRENYMRPYGFSGNTFHRPSEPVPDVRYDPVPATPPVEPIWA